MVEVLRIQLICFSTIQPTF